MEVLLAFLVFGVLGAITIYGFMSSSRTSRELEQRGLKEDRTMAGVSAE